MQQNKWRSRWLPRFAVMHLQLAAPIIGATKMDHLEDAIASVELELTADEIDALEAPYKPHAVKGFFN